MLHDTGFLAVLVLALFISAMGGFALFRGYNRIAGTIMIAIGVGLALFVSFVFSQ